MSDLFQPETMGQALTFLRIKAGITRDDACKRSAISAGTLSRYENDVSDRVDIRAIARHAAMLAEALGREPVEVWDELLPLLMHKDELEREISDRVVDAHAASIIKPAAARARRQAEADSAKA